MTNGYYIVDTITDYSNTTIIIFGILVFLTATTKGTNNLFVVCPFLVEVGNVQFTIQISTGVGDL